MASAAFRVGTGGSGGAAKAEKTAALRSAVVMAAAGLVTVAPFVVWYALRPVKPMMMSGGMHGSHAMRMTVDDHLHAFTNPILQATGIAALLWGYMSVATGLLDSGRRPSWSWWSRASVDRFHRHSSLTLVALIFVHAIATAFNGYNGINFAKAFVPWALSWPAGVTAYNVGIFSFYLALVVGPTYYLRRRIGTARWRLLHRISLAVYVLALWHTLLIGDDFSNPSWVRQLLWLAQIPLLGLLCYRLTQPSRQPRDRAARAVCGVLALMCCAAIASIVVLVGTGHAMWPAKVGAMVMSSSPEQALAPWLGVTAATVLAVVCWWHVRHARGGCPGLRFWHGAHVLMAVGMIVMYLPGGMGAIPSWVGQVVFVGAAVVCGIAWATTGGQGTGFPIAWVVTLIDLVVMMLMFGLPDQALRWLVVISVAWMFLQAMVWARAMWPGARSLTTPAGQITNAGTSDAIRASLLIMNVAMAYMLLAMQFGATAMPAMPGMAHG